jgi:hypothetical protein
MTLGCSRYRFQYQPARLVPACMYIDNMSHQTVSPSALIRTGCLLHGRRWFFRPDDVLHRRVHSGLGSFSPSVCSAPEKDAISDAPRLRNYLLFYGHLWIVAPIPSHDAVLREGVPTTLASAFRPPLFTNPTDLASTTTDQNSAMTLTRRPRTWTLVMIKPASGL